MNDPNTPTPAAQIPTSPATPSSPPVAANALEIACQLHANSIDAVAAGKLARAGGISSMQVAQALQVLRETGEQQGPNVRSLEAVELDQHFPGAKPEEYVIAYARPGQDVVMTQELRRFDTTARTWMSDAGLPVNIGNSLVSAIAKVAEQTKGMNEDQLAGPQESPAVKGHRR